MAIGLMAPLFLAGLLAIAIPVFVHLMHKERKDPVPFPSLMFLRRVPFRSARRQRIRYWLLFLMRTLALVLIVAAFARPWLSSPRTAAATSGGKDIILLIDRSYSMSAANVWSRVKREAAEVIRAAGASDRVAVAAFGERAQLLARWEDGRYAALSAINTLDAGHDATRYAPALRLAGSLLAQSRGPAEIVWITDRQQNASRNVEAVEVPPSTTVRTIDVRPSGIRNLAVTHVDLASTVFAGQTRITPSASVVNRNATAANVALELRVDGRVQQARTVSVPANDSARVTFTPMVGAAATGEVRIRGRDDLATDDVAYFAIAARSTPLVRVRSGSTDASFYFENALLAGDTGAFRLTRAGARLAAVDLNDADVLVFLQAAPPRGGMGAMIQRFVEGGGGLIILGTAASGASELLPVRDLSPVERRAEPASIAAIDLSHPVFAPFRADGTSPFAGVRVHRYLSTRAADGARIIARFDDGKPALVEQRLGRGRILYWASDLTRASGDLVLQPAFVPFIQQLVRYAAEPARVTRAFTVGHVIGVDQFVPATQDAIVTTPDNQRIRLAATDAARTLRVDRAGVYQIRGETLDERTESVVANVDPNEADLTALPVSFFESAVTTRASTATSTSVAGVVPREDASRQMIWWYLLAAAFALLAVETLIGNRISIARQAWR